MIKQKLQNTDLQKKSLTGYKNNILKKHYFYRYRWQQNEKSRIHIISWNFFL
mgnify:CR=1 FL=1|jgi:hypothetical protein